MRNALSIGHRGEGSDVGLGIFRMLRARPLGVVVWYDSDHAAEEL